jgi:DUF4097 and DUF4098 domain-containing protein YvlB
MNKRTFKVLIIGPALAAILAQSYLIGAAANGPTSGKGQKLSRGGSVQVENQSGPITVVGWDQDTVQASVANIDASEQESAVSVHEERPGLISIRTTVRGRPHGGEAHLLINLPRSAGIESLNTGHGTVEVTNVEGPVNVNSRSGNLKITNVGKLSGSTGEGDIEVRSVSGEAKLQTRSGNVTVAGVSGRVNIQTLNGNVTADRIGQLFVHTNSGDIKAAVVNGPATLDTNSGEVTATDVEGDLSAKVTSGDFKGENITGLVSLTIANGDVSAINIGGDIKVSSISSDINIKCAKANVDLGSVSGSITLAGIAGDVNAITTSGDISLSEAIRPEGHYKLKSVSGEVTILIQPDSPGFTATLSSYNGEIETDFPIELDSPLEHGPVNRRVIGHYGDSKADITLDTFSGTARLGKLVARQSVTCK